MQKIKVVDIINMQAALTALANTKLPAKSSYRISKGLNKVQQVITRTNYKQQALFAKLGKPTEDGAQIAIPPENLEAFQQEMGVIMDEQVDMDIQPIHISVLGDLLIEPAHLAALDGFMLSSIAEVDTAQ